MTDPIYIGLSTSKSGGGSAAIDGVADAKLEDGYQMLCMEDGEATLHSFDDTETASESVPDYIAPDDASGNGRWELQALLAKYIRRTWYCWEDDFDQEAAAVQFESGLNADFWTTAGTNYAAANVTFVAGAGGHLEIKCAASDNDSVNILGLPHFRVDANPIFECRFKIDNIATAGCYVGLVEGAFVDINTVDDDIFCVGFNADDGHGLGATELVCVSNDAGAGAVYGDMGATIANDTFVTVRFDLSDTEQPRVWINEAEVAAASITGTVQAGTTLMPFAVVQNLAGGAIQRKLTIDYMRVWQERA